MEEIGRRSALVLGLAAAAAPVLVSSRAAMARKYGPDEGKEEAPGVRVIELSNRNAIIPGYKTVKMVDVVFQPGAHAPQEVMENDWVCNIIEGELRIMVNGQELKLKADDVYTCAKGVTEEDWNDGDTVAVMRAIGLMTA
jgi:quercetin dioxygenase-like cupin family protein